MTRMLSAYLSPRSSPSLLVMLPDESSLRQLFNSTNMNNGTYT